MRVLFVNISDTEDESAIAARRLLEALKNNGIKTKMLVRHKGSELITVAEVPGSALPSPGMLWEKFITWKAGQPRKGGQSPIDMATTGTDITTLPEFKEADIIHLHQVGRGFLSLKNIRRIIDSGKPIVWTMHDSWPFTAICHHCGTCTNYRTGCRRCPLLAGGGSDNDLSARTFHRKQQMLRGARIIFVASSRYIENAASQSALLVGQEVICIPDTINFNIFCPTDRTEARKRFNLPADKRLLLLHTFSCHTQQDIELLQEACRIVKEKEKEWARHIGIVVTGENAELLRNCFPFSTYIIEYVRNEKLAARLYNAADAYLTLSQEEALPPTVMEALSCGTPCLGIRAGGITEIIDHKENGYLATPQDAENLAEGISFVLAPNTHEDLSAKALHKALSNYGETHIATKYIAQYLRATEK